ncbi:hypothetical protein BV898_19386 [Hypsibius exemplaris]|uniref:Uncharacterized protein n=1 Tax=Hypsibius exemplaris TaxID=2072580 RepID=A0A9X6NQM4_HYPEX|nr:hypothetical protein BV898_19386 [Hypsibius exemplaris]
MKALRPKQKEWYERFNCTYFGAPDVDKRDDYLLGFTLKIQHGVCSGVDGEGGWLCDLRHANQKDKTFACFITSSGFRSVSKFQADIGKTPGMPAIIVTTLDAKTLSSFVVWKNSKFAELCKQNKLQPDKLPVEHRNLQDDGFTYSFSSTLFFERRLGSVTSIPAASSNYVWVAQRLPGLEPLEIYTGTNDHDVLETIRQKLDRDGMQDTFISFLLVCGHTAILNLHYKAMIELFSHVPGLITTGPRNTGKTLSAEVSAAFLGTNAEKICVTKDTSLSALRDRYTEDHMPLIIHDCLDSNTVATALHECFEGRPVKKHEKQMAPGASIIVTCNEKQMEFLQTRQVIILLN